MSQRKKQDESMFVNKCTENLSKNTLSSRRTYNCGEDLDKPLDRLG